MKIYKTGKAVPAGSLIANFLPVDYTDVYVCEADTETGLTPDDVVIGCFTDHPAWVDALYKLRHFLVRFVGLKSKEEDPKALERLVREGGSNGFVSVSAKNANETVMLLTDKHLDAHLSVHIDGREISLITLVRYHNRLGRVYFFVIRPFHGLVVKGQLKRALKNAVRNKAM